VTNLSLIEVSDLLIAG